ncbi:hypothetical protein D1007_02731 [Hordeum vulgare]|nr:hypothetical protein D1007_02731 [Hordeum vulgare]
MVFGVHPMENHMRKTDLTVVYTNDLVMVEDSVNTMERLLAEGDKYKVVGFNLAYTGSRSEHDQKVVIAQLCVHHHVLLYHYCLATMPRERCSRFLNSSEYMFSMVDTTNDPKVLKILGLACQKLVDIRGHYKSWGSKKDMDSHVDP